MRQKLGKLKVKKYRRHNLDIYEISADRIEQVPVITLSPTVTLYRSKIIENLLNVFVDLKMFNIDQWNNFVEHMKLKDQRVVVKKGCRYQKTYIRICM